MTTPTRPAKKQLAPPWYHLLVAEFEARRYAVGLAMEDMDELMGHADRSYAKLVHPDTPSGRVAVASKLQWAFNVLYPSGVKITLAPIEPGDPMEGHGVENSEGSRKKIKAEAAHWHRGTRLQHMRDIGSRGGKARAASMPAARRSEIARIAGLASAAARQRSALS